MVGVIGNKVNLLASFCAARREKHLWRWASARRALDRSACIIKYVGEVYAMKITVGEFLATMKKNFALFGLSFTLLFNACNSSSPPPPPTASPATATATANVGMTKEAAEKLIKQLATQGGCKDSTADMRLSFTDAEGKAQQMDFRLQRKYEGSKVATLMTVQAPKEESEKALLVFQEEGKPTDVISYLAGLKKVAHLKSDNPLNFRGSKSTVQEMLGMELGNYEVVGANAVTVAGASEWQLELKAKSGLSLSYPKVIVAYDASGAKLQRFELSDSRAEKVKTIAVREVKAMQNYQTITAMEIEDHKHNQKLKLETRSIKYDTNLAPALFTEANFIKTVTAASQKQLQ